MEDQLPRSATPASLFAKLLDALLLYLFFLASQGFTLLNLPLRLLGAQALRDHPWIVVYEGHLWELAFALGYIAIASRGNFSAYGLNLKDTRLSLRIFWRFCLIFLLVTIAWQVIPALMSHQTELGNFGPPTQINILAWLAFEWVFVGIVEEIMFRGLIQTQLARTWTGIWNFRGLEIPTAGVVTAVLFCLAHINPLHPHIYWQQQVLAFGLGLYYSIVRHRTGSLLNPILAHNAGDGMIVTALYMLYFSLR